MSVVRGATVGLIVAVLGVLGASGAWPTARSGPDIERTLRSVAVPGWGAVLAVEGSSVADGAATVWRLDVRGWDWERFSQLPAGTGDLDLLAVVPGRRAVYSVPRSPGGVSVLDLTTREHRMLPAPAIRPSDVTDIAVDADRGRILAWSDGTDELWSYAPGANRWAEVPRTEPWPTAAFPDGQHGYTLMTYDSRADRAVLAVLPVPGRPGST